MPLVYNELRRLAAEYLRRERVGHTLQPTALVNEPYLKLIDQKNAKWQNRARFFGISAQLMRRILVDHRAAAPGDQNVVVPISKDFRSPVLNSLSNSRKWICWR
jgi:hypothetical protein